MSREKRPEEMSGGGGKCVGRIFRGGLQGNVSEECPGEMSERECSIKNSCTDLLVKRHTVKS